MLSRLLPGSCASPKIRIAAAIGERCAKPPGGDCRRQQCGLSATLPSFTRTGAHCSISEPNFCDTPWRSCSTVWPIILCPNLSKPLRAQLRYERQPVRARRQKGRPAGNAMVTLNAMRSGALSRLVASHCMSAHRGVGARPIAAFSDEPSQSAPWRFPFRLRTNRGP